MIVIMIIIMIIIIWFIVTRYRTCGGDVSGSAGGRSVQSDGRSINLIRCQTSLIAWSAPYQQLYTPAAKR